MFQVLKECYKKKLWSDLNLIKLYQEIKKDFNKVMSKITPRYGFTIYKRRLDIY